MAVPSGGDLLRLAASKPDDAQARLEKMFAWHVDRYLAITRGMFGTALTVAVAIGLAFAQGDLQLDGAGKWVFWGAASTVIVVSAGSGILAYLRVRVVEKAYPATLKLYEDLRPVAEVVRPYL